MASQRLELNVTQAHIDRGQHSSSRCPVALALFDAFGCRRGNWLRRFLAWDDWVSVGISSAHVRARGVVHDIALPARVGLWIATYEVEDQVEPFSLSLPVRGAPPTTEQADTEQGGG